MSLLDADLTEKIDIPMIFDAIDKLRKVMDDNLEKIAMHEKEMSALYKNVSNARFELENVKNLLDEIVNPKPKYNDTDSKFKNIDLNSELQKSFDGSLTYTDNNSGWWCPSNYSYSTTAAITANMARYLQTYPDAATYDTKTITGI